MTAQLNQTDVDADHRTAGPSVAPTGGLRRLRGGRRSLRSARRRVLWLVPALLLPDLAMIGYLAGPRIGALAYNAVHNWASRDRRRRGGDLARRVPITLAGVILIAHTGMDRSVGYGLKFMSGFHDTHSDGSDGRLRRLPRPRPSPPGQPPPSPAPDEPGPRPNVIRRHRRAPAEPSWRREGSTAVTMQAVAEAGRRPGAVPLQAVRRTPRARSTRSPTTSPPSLARPSILRLPIDDPGEAIRLVADRYRAFALRSPGAYQLLFTTLLPRGQPEPRPRTRPPRLARSALTERLVGRGRALEAARLLNRVRPRVREHRDRRRVPARWRRRRGVSLRRGRAHRRLRPGSSPA